jgi:phenylalanyl-tRNA synthetase beta chain
MNIPYSWLKELLPQLEQTPHNLEPILAMLGTGVESITHFPAPPSGVIFGVVQTCTPIPETHLFTLEVNVGLPETKQVVTGAPNAKADIGVAIAPPGTTIQGVRLEERQMQGITSWGMACSAVRNLGRGLGAGCRSHPQPRRCAFGFGRGA